MSPPDPASPGTDAPDLRAFSEAYAAHRAHEGRGRGGLDELLALPWLTEGPLARSWAVRARTFERFMSTVLRPLARRRLRGPLRILDAGAGNGWLCYRLSLEGHRALALDMRTDVVDGLGAAAGYREILPTPFPRVAASFEALPFRAASFDMVVFNASIHYALELARPLDEAARVLADDGVLAILDSPFYATSAAGEAMVTEKRADAARRFGERADVLTSRRTVEYLTPERLGEASRGADLTWVRHRVRYPLWYELRPIKAALARRRRPSRFDLWVGTRSSGGAP